MNMNTFNKGRVRVLIYRDDVENVWYATALEFNLTVDGTNKNDVFDTLNRMIPEYLDSARDIGDVSIINQEPDPELVQLWEAHIAETQNTIPSPYTAHFAGVQSITA